jgi:hypothetical protein
LNLAPAGAPTDSRTDLTPTNTRCLGNSIGPAHLAGTRRLGAARPDAAARRPGRPARCSLAESDIVPAGSTSRWNLIARMMPLHDVRIAG